MKFFSLTNKSKLVSARQAIMNGLDQDGGLYMPEVIPNLAEFLNIWDENTSLATIAKAVTGAFFSEDIPQKSIDRICESAFCFDTPLRFLDDETAILELFHGPTLAFKDIGARFLARVVSYFAREKPVCVIVATSGDTGGAVADAFFDVANTRVIVLYPYNGVSPAQESQFASLGKNILALKLNGTFDECQKLAKQLLVDKDLQERFDIVSANSINIARLIPQSVYYFRAWLLARAHGWKKLVFCVPSGNFGNITAGTLAFQMGLDGVSFIAATNTNDTVPRFFSHGAYQVKPSVATISNAMDVGSPSNFYRWYSLYQDSFEVIRAGVRSFSISDTETEKIIFNFSEHHKDALDPHTGVGLAARIKYKQDGGQLPVIVLGTAHAAKFAETVQGITGKKISLPQTLVQSMAKPLLSMQVNGVDEIKARIIA